MLELLPNLWWQGAREQEALDCDGLRGLFLERFQQSCLSTRILIAFDLIGARPGGANWWLERSLPMTPGPAVSPI
jgi:hypothetical protein